MRKLVSFCALLCAMATIAASPARAQSVLWVAANGNDGNACSQAAPCLTFQGAVGKGNVAQINCLTSGNFGSVALTTSITIDCGTGNIGEIVLTPFDTSGIAISGNAIIVVLRHLSINGGGTTSSGLDGINAANFGNGTLVVEDCIIHGFHGGAGIEFNSTTGRGLLHVSNTLIFDNHDGIDAFAGSNQITSLTLNGVQLIANSFEGLHIGGPGIVAGTMRNSVVGENGHSGVIAVGPTFGPTNQVFFTIEESSLIANLTAGVAVNAPAGIINVGNSTIAANTNGVEVDRGTINSFGNNQITGNAHDGAFSATLGLR
jgi:hypothetical protein